MRKIYCFFLFYLTITFNAFGKQWIIFYAEKPSKEAKGGHAFASFIQEDIFKKQTKLVGCWGFYPRLKVPQAIWGTVPAELRDDWKTHRDYSFLVEVSTEEFNRCLRIKDLYKKRLEYSLYGQSCVNFVRDLINAIPKLIPPSEELKFPDDIVKELKKQNKTIEEKSVESFSSSIGNTTNPKLSEWSDNQTSQSFKINDEKSSDSVKKFYITYGSSKAFNWIKWSEAPNVFVNMAKEINVDVSGKTLYQAILKDYETCNVEVAAIDLNDDKIIGLILKVAGLKCTGQYSSEYYDVFENGGMLTVNIRIDEVPIPYPNGVKFETGIEKLKNNPFSKYKTTASIPPIFKLNLANSSQNKNQSTDNNVSVKTTSSLSMLNSLNGKYPFEVDIFENPILKQRLQKLVGTEFQNLKAQLFGVTGPYEVRDGIFYFWGMVPHSGGDPGAVIMADINQDILYVGIRRNKKIQFYKEKQTPIPQKMIEWSKEKTF